ncbi:MAG: hypothetical protein AAFP69_15850 [Planctomycetota bacterium]
MKYFRDVAGLSQASFVGATAGQAVSNVNLLGCAISGKYFPDSLPFGPASGKTLPAVASVGPGGPIENNCNIRGVFASHATDVAQHVNNAISRGDVLFVAFRRDDFTAQSSVLNQSLADSGLSLSVGLDATSIEPNKNPNLPRRLQWRQKDDGPDLNISTPFGPLEWATLFAAPQVESVSGHDIIATTWAQIDNDPWVTIGNAIAAERIGDATIIICTPSLWARTSNFGDDPNDGLGLCLMLADAVIDVGSQ